MWQNLMNIKWLPLQRSRSYSLLSPGKVPLFLCNFWNVGYIKTSLSCSSEYLNWVILIPIMIIYRDIDVPVRHAFVLNISTTKQIDEIVWTRVTSIASYIDHIHTFPKVPPILSYLLNLQCIYQNMSCSSGWSRSYSEFGNLNTNYLIMIIYNRKYNVRGIWCYYLQGATIYRVLYKKVHS